MYTQRVNVSGESVKECGNEWRSVSQLVSCPGCDELPGNAGANPEQVEWGDLMVEWPSKLAGLKGGCVIQLTLISHLLICIFSSIHIECCIIMKACMCMPFNFIHDYAQHDTYSDLGKCSNIYNNNFCMCGIPYCLATIITMAVRWLKNRTIFLLLVLIPQNQSPNSKIKMAIVAIWGNAWSGSG